MHIHPMALGQRYVRGTISSAAPDLCEVMWGSLSSDRHPLESIIQVFWHIDKEYNRGQLMGCIADMQRIEKALQDLKGRSPGTLSVDLNKLNTKISELRACVQYVKASVESMLSSDPVNDINLHAEVIYEHQGGPRPKVMYQIMKNQLCVDWYKLDLNLVPLKMMCNQRLLDLDTITQRLNISLSVVSPSKS
jgi:hypothetical protein